MYGYTPPAVIAVDADLLSDCGGFQRIAAALAAQLKMRSVWVVVGAPFSLEEAAADDRVMAVEAFYRDPRDAPESVPDPATAVADALAQHVRDLGTTLPVRMLPVEPQAPPPGGAVVPGTWYDAADVARALGARAVLAWATEPALVPAKVRGIPFRFARPDAPLGGALV